MKTKILPLAIWLLCFNLPSVFSQYTPKYIVVPSEYNCYIIPSATHKVYDVAGGLPALIPNQPSYVAQVAGSLHHACLLDTLGNCYCWGDNNNGEIGNGAISAANVPAIYHVATDSLGNPFTNIVQVMPGGNTYGYETAALKRDGTVWIWGNTSGGNRGNGQKGGTNTRPVQVNFPAGIVIKKIQIDIVCIALDASGNVWTWGGNAGYLAPYLLAQGTYSPNPTVPHKISLPSPAKDITGGSMWNYALLTDGSLYGWAYYSAFLGLGNTGFASEPGALDVPQLLNAQLGLPHPISSVVVSSSATYVILTDSTIWAWGDNAAGAIGNGQELDFSKYTTGPSPAGGAPAPYNWDWALGELLQQKPVQIAKGLHSFTNIWATGNDVFYCYAEDVNGQLYSWGRGKGGVLGNAVMAGGPGGIGAIYPNSWDVPWVTAVNPFGLTKILPSTSPYCVLNPSGSPCNGYANPVSAAPAVSAGPNQNITGTATTLSGTATPGNASIMSYLWNQVSGPNTPQITLNTGAVAQLTGLIAGTYIFQLKATDNNWRSNSSTVTIVMGLPQSITVNAGASQTITMPANSVTLVGTATGNNGATIASTGWTESAGPNTATIASPSGLSTMITGMIAGTYTFKLTANGSGIDTSAMVAVTVGAAAVISNPVPSGYMAIPGTVQAENYATMSGVQTENTADAGGGLNVGWINQGDWMKYNLSVAGAATYTVGFRVATIMSGGTLQLRDAAGNVLVNVNVPTTGNWQAWQTVTASVTLPAGNQTLQVYNNGFANWNINWMNFSSSATAASQPTVMDQQAAVLSDALAGSTGPSLTLYPNPAHDNITLSIDNDHTGKMIVQVINGSGQTIKTYDRSKEGQTSATDLNISDLPAGAYFIRIQIGAWQTVKKIMKF